MAHEESETARRVVEAAIVWHEARTRRRIRATEIEAERALMAAVLRHRDAGVRSFHGAGSTASLLLAKRETET